MSSSNNPTQNPNTVPILMNNDPPGQPDAEASSAHHQPDGGTPTIISDRDIEQTSGRGHFFRLPTELRHIVYEDIVSSGRVFCAEGFYDTGAQRWKLRNRYGNEQPALASLCYESREYITGRAVRVFKDADIKNEDSGWWWNPAVDILVFDKHFCKLEHHAFDRVDSEGLEHVWHLGLDRWQARQLGYSVGYTQDYDFTVVPTSAREVSTSAAE